jgi:hypothetical protein
MLTKYALLPFRFPSKCETFFERFDEKSSIGTQMKMLRMARQSSRNSKTSSRAQTALTGQTSKSHGGTASTKVRHAPEIALCCANTMPAAK